MHGAGAPRPVDRDARRLARRRDEGRSRYRGITPIRLRLLRAGGPRRHVSGVGGRADVFRAEGAAELFDEGLAQGSARQALFLAAERGTWIARSE
jgi:hypothetical protein